jgi:hypothetical protein
VVGRGVDQVQHAGGEGGGGEQGERYFGAVGEEFLAVSDDDGVDQEVEFVEQVFFEEPADQGGAACGGELVVLFELA